MNLGRGQLLVQVALVRKACPKSQHHALWADYVDHLVDIAVHADAGLIVAQTVEIVTGVDGECGEQLRVRRICYVAKDLSAERLIGGLC